MATAYYANRISPNQIETPVEGYRICRNVPICRTGYQEYRGWELKKHPSYDPAWGLNDDDLYRVDRPLDEVTSPETIASFEGKSITDEHPDEEIAPGSLISCETERELGCGHVQNVRIGDPLPKGVPLLADMHVKDDALIDKIDGGVRDISCGYTYLLKRLDDGTLIQTNIRGNHVAVVPRGRAGPDVAIKDSIADAAVIALPMPSPAPHTNQEKPTFMSLFHNVFGRGVKDYAQDANTKPEDLTQLFLSVGRDADPEKKKDDAKDKSTKDADDKDAKIAELEATIAEMKKKAEPEKKSETDRKVAKDDAVDDLEDLHEDLETLKEDIVDKSGDVVDDKKKAAESESEDDDDSSVIDPDDEDKTMADGTAKVKAAVDSARALVKALRPAVASGKAPKATVDAYNGAVKALNATRGVAKDAYVGLAKVKGPDMDKDSTVLLSPYESGIFTGGSYEDNVAKFQAALKGGK